MSDPRAAILALAEQSEKKPLEGIPGAFVRKLSVEEIDRLSETKKNSAALLLVMSVCDEGGKPLFTDDDIASLLKLPGDRFRVFYRQAMTFNGMSPDAAEEAAKN